MSDYRRDSVDPTAPLTHTDAEALISARLDGPLDPAMNRALQAHLATCDSCRAFAAEMEMMATAFRDFPSLPPSSAVSRRVRAEIRSGGSPMRKFSRWITTSRSAPLTALGGAAVALALVVASVFGNLGGDDGNNNNNPSLGAPQSAQNLTSTSESGDNAPTTAASNSTRQAAPTATTQPNVTAPEPTSANDGDGSGSEPTQTLDAANADVTQTADEPTQQAQTSGDNGENPTPTQSAAADGGDGNPAAATGPSDGGGAPTAEPTREGQPTAAFGAASEEGTPAPEETATPEPTATPTEESTPEPQPTETPTEEPTNTPEPEPTETPTEEPTSTPEPEPTQTPTEEPTNTPEPEPTETPTQEPTATPTEDTSSQITAASGATPEPSPSPTASPTPEPATPTPSPTEGASIVPRGDSQPDDQTQEAVETPTPESNAEAATEEAGQGGDSEESPPIQSTNDDNRSDTGAAEDVTPESDGVGGETGNSTPEDASKKNNGTEESATAGPLNFGDLATAGYSVSVYGTYLPGGPNGSHAAEQRGGGLQIVDSNGGVITSGYGYNPVWGGDGSLYTAGGAISEGASAINQWSGGDGPGFVTQGDYLDVPAGDGSGGFYFVRELPGAATLELHVINGGDPIWTAEGYSLVSQTVYIYGDVVYIPTDQGWLAVPAGGGEETLLGSAIQFTYDLLLDAGSGQIAFVDDSGNVYVAPATDPSAAGQVGGISGNGGIAWTSYGLAIASGDTVTINGVPVITGGGDLGAPVWTGSELLVADAAAGGEVRIATDAEIQKALGY